MADTFIEDWFHPMIKRTFGINMDELQVKFVNEQMPPFTIETASKITAFAFVGWFLVFVICHYVLVLPFMSCFKNVGWVKPFHELKPSQ